jgi:uncharacterized protein YbjT (DUF2867 family)
MILLCGATGDLGGRIADRLASRGVEFRAMVRPGKDDARLQRLGARVMRADLTRPQSLEAALTGVQVVISTANAMARLLAGSKDVSISAVDLDGNASLVRAAEAAGVARFVFLSLAGIGPEASRRSAFAAAKEHTEELLRSSRMHEVCVRPDKFHEVWLAPVTGIVPEKRRAVIYGRGRTPEAYVASDDVAEACVRLAVHDDPPRTLTFGGPEALTRVEVVEAFERAFGGHFRRFHVPRTVLATGAKVLAGVKPEIASIMGLALTADLNRISWDAQPLRELGIEPRPASAYIAALAQDRSAAQP